MLRVGDESVPGLTLGYASPLADEAERYHRPASSPSGSAHTLGLTRDSAPARPQFTSDRSRWRWCSKPGIAAGLLAARTDVFERSAACLRHETGKKAPRQGVAVTFGIIRGDSFAELQRIVQKTFALAGRRPGGAQAPLAAILAVVGRLASSSRRPHLRDAGKWPWTGPRPGARGTPPAHRASHVKDRDR